MKNNKFVFGTSGLEIWLGASFFWHTVSLIIITLSYNILKDTLKPFDNDFKNKQQKCIK